MGTSVRWSSKLSFIFAASAAAIGLGNIWRFPFLVGQNGGGAFVILYLLCVVVLGLPLLYLEVVLGRIGRKNPMAVFRDLAARSNISKRWSWLGFATLLSAFLIVTYYVVIVGWVLDYTFRAGLGHFANITAAVSKKEFSNLTSSSWQMLVTDSVVIIATMVIILMGIKKGLEKAVMIMFPLLLILMVMLIVHSFFHSGFIKAMQFLFIPHFSQITPKVVLTALGQAFFSLNVAMGITMMFSAYLPEGASLIRCSLGVAFADTGFAILAGLVIFPVVFTYHLSPSVGPSLIFQILPVAFGQMHFGSFIATAFFLMLFFAAFSSVISLFEPSVCLLIEERKMSRFKAVVVLGILCWLLSLLSIGSFSVPVLFSIMKVTFFDAIDFFTSSIMLPVNGILLAIFGGWLLDKNILKQELNWSLLGFGYVTWNFILRYVAPVVVALILLMSFGVL